MFHPTHIHIEWIIEYPYTYKVNPRLLDAKMAFPFGAPAGRQSIGFAKPHPISLATQIGEAKFVNLLLVRNLRTVHAYLPYRPKRQRLFLWTPQCMSLYPVFPQDSTILSHELQEAKDTLVVRSIALRGEDRVEQATAEGVPYNGLQELRSLSSNIPLRYMVQCAIYSTHTKTC